MAEERDMSLEESFRKRSETLRSFYEADSVELSEHEQQSLTPILNSLQDANVPRYRELEPIGQGGEKRIALVHDNRLDRRVAMARSVKANDPQDQEAFLREARLTANLPHPNIMPIYNMGLGEDGLPFFSMELVEGDSLKVILRKLAEGDAKYCEEYPLEQLLKIYLKVCDAVAYAHSRNVLHLDIKPDNIKVGDFGEVLVCDWGLASVINAPAGAEGEETDLLDGDILNDITLSGTMKGTPGFMAPEQTRAYQRKTPQTDIYALGALLYNFLTRKLPVDGKSANEIIQNTRDGRIIPPRRRMSAGLVPKGLAAVAMKALALEPADRYASVISLQHEINLYLSGYPTQAEHAGWITSTSLLLQRHSRITFLLLFFLLLLAGVIGGNLVAISREKAEAVAAREEAEENFTLYRREQQLAENLHEDLGEALIYTAASSEFINARSMLRVLESGLSEERGTVERKHLLMQKGRLHFVLQEFNAAHQCFSPLKDNSSEFKNLKALSARYARIKKMDRRVLSDQQLANLFNQSRPADKDTLYYMYYHHMRRRPEKTAVEQYVPLAKAVLDKLNYVNPKKTPKLRLLKLADGSYHLNLAKSQYWTFTINIRGIYRQNVLEPLRLQSLDISRSKVTSLKTLHGIKLKTLNMTGVQDSNKRWLANTLKPLDLDKLILTVADYPKETVEQLKKKMTVVDSSSKK